MSQAPAPEGGRSAAPAALQVVSGSGPLTISALPAEVNLRIYAGDDFTMAVVVSDAAGEPVDLSAAEARSHIRRAVADPEIAGEFVVGIDGNQISLHLPGEVSAALPRRCVWDVEIQLEGATTTLAAGSIAVTAEVSR